MDKFYEEGYKLALENAKIQFAVAEKTAESEHYGLAVSLLILASEEAVKAFSIFTKGLFEEDSFPEYDRVFQSHEVKIAQIRALVLFGETIKQLVNLVYLPMLIKLYDSTSKESDYNKIGIEAFKNRVKSHIILRKSSVYKSIKWWQHAKNLKEDGLYIKPNGASWHSPTKFGRKAYCDARAHVSEILSLVKEMESLDLKAPHFKYLIKSLGVKLSDFK